MFRLRMDDGATGKELGGEEGGSASQVGTEEIGRAIIVTSG